MSMKLHLVAASDIISKGLDPSFPHSDIGTDGLLAGPSQVEVPAAPVVTTTTVTVEVVPVQVEEPVADDMLVVSESTVETPEATESEPEAEEEAEAPEEKKTPARRGRAAKSA